MEERGLVGLEARTEDGVEAGRIIEVLTDEETGEVTHVMVERGEEQYEIPISSVTLDPEAEFATFHSDRSDIEPGDHLGDEIEPESYSPAQTSGPEDYPHEGQFAAAPEDPAEAQSAEELDRQTEQAGGWEDESDNTPESGYPRTDAYIDPQTGEAVEGYPEAADAESLEEAADLVLGETDLQVVSISEGVVELVGSASGDEELDRVSSDLMNLDEIFEVDTTGVELA